MLTVECGCGEDEGLFREDFRMGCTANPAIPYDSHELAALIAPRGLLVLHQDLGWSSRAENVYNTMRVNVNSFEALGAGDAVGLVQVEGKVNHCAVVGEWAGPVERFIKRFLRGEKVNTSGLFSKAPGVREERWGDGWQLEPIV